VAYRLLAASTALWALSAIAAEKPTQLWNLTSATIVGFKLSHAGSGEYGENLAASDADGVDHDERLKINDIPTGRYDAELKYKNGRTCFARNVEIVAGKVFSIEDKSLTACSRK
jgi:hypothetical protein